MLLFLLLLFTFIYGAKCQTCVTVSTLAGSTVSGSSNGIGTSASFMNPSGIAIDSLAGVVYVAESSNFIRAITVSTQSV